MGGRNLAILAVAVVLGIIAVYLANAYFSGVEEQQQRVASSQEVTPIVVASAALEFGTPLTADKVRLQAFPSNSVPQGAFTSVEALLGEARVALRPMVPGEPVLADKVSGRGGRAVFSALLPAGARAVSIPVTEVSGVSGFVRPNDIVDVILIRQIPGAGAGPEDMMADVILEAVPVLAIDQNASETSTEPAVGSTAVLQVDQYGAQRLALAQRVGQLSLALRNAASTEPGSFLTVTTRDLGDAGIYMPAAVQFAPAPERPVMAAPAPAQAPAAAARRSGPSMTVVRGTDNTDYEVGRLGNR